MMNKKIEMNISNKLFYSVLSLIVIIVLGVGVYAYGGTNPPVMGHTMGELMPSCTGWLKSSGTANTWSCTTVPPACTGTNQVLHWSGSVWSCYTVDTGFACAWTGWNPYFISYPSLTEDCYYIDTCYVQSDCSTELCPYRLDGYAATPPPEWNTYATPVQQVECTGGEITQMRYASVCPTDATSACGYVETSP